MAIIGQKKHRQAVKKQYLTLVEDGCTHAMASRLVGYHPRTVTRWAEEDGTFALEYMRAREKGKVVLAREAMSVLRLAARQGNTWCIARLFAYADPKTWKEINAKLREAEPELQSMHVADGGRGVTLMQLIEIAQRGGRFDGHKPER